MRAVLWRDLKVTTISYQRNIENEVKGKKQESPGMIIFVHIWAYNPKKGKGIFISIIYCICILVFNIFVFLGLGVGLPGLFVFRIV